MTYRVEISPTAIHDIENIFLWLIINYKEGDTIEVKSINLSLAIEQVYRGLDLTP